MNKSQEKSDNEYSYPHSKRVTRPREYTEVFSKNKYRSGDNCWLLLAKPNNLNQNRIGLVISKKVSKKAVVRNRLKRIIRENFRQKSNTEFSGFDIVVIGRSKAAVVTNQELNSSFDNQWVRIVKKAKRGN